MKAGIGSIKNIIAIASGKGGVGKSTVAVNLAFALKSKGFIVGLMDADIYGPSQPGLLGKREQPKGFEGAIVPLEIDGLKFISMGNMNQTGKANIMRSPMILKALSQFIMGVRWGDLDYLLVDLPPGTGDVQLTLSQQAKLSGAIIVTTPQRVALEISYKGLNMFQVLNVPILGIIENMSGFSCKHCGKTTDIFKIGGGKTLASSSDVPFLGSIPLDPEVMVAGDEGRNLIESNPNANSSRMFMKIAEKVIEVQNKISAEIFEPMHVQIDCGKLKIVWKEDSTVIYDTFKLRLNCPCADCVDENTGKRRITEKQIPLDISATRFNLVGRYGVSVHFSDGHNTGIYTLKLLMEMPNDIGKTSFSV